MEYRYAEEKNIPIIAFPYFNIGKLPKEYTESDPELMNKLETFEAMDNNPPKDTIDLAQGDDKIELEYLYSESHKLESKQSISLSWNEIMNIILPVIDNSESEFHIEIALANYMRLGHKSF